MKDILDFLTNLYSLPVAGLVAILGIVLGYILKFWKKFPNDGIPPVVILACGAAAPLMATPPGNGDSIRIWAFKNIVVGLAIGLLAWLAHNQVLKRIEDKLGLFSNGAGSGPPSPPVPPAATLLMCFLLPAFLLMGCASTTQKASTSTYNPTNDVLTITEAQTSAHTLFDSKTTIEKMRASAGKTSSVGAAGVAEESSSAGVQAIIQALMNAAIEIGKAQASGGLVK